jgi:hypothetical protein
MDYNKLNLTELRSLAKERGIHAVTGYRKPELIELLMKNENESVSVQASYSSTEAESTHNTDTIGINNGTVDTSRQTTSHHSNYPDYIEQLDSGYT